MPCMLVKGPSRVFSIDEDDGNFHIVWDTMRWLGVCYVPPWSQPSLSIYERQCIMTKMNTSPICLAFSDDSVIPKAWPGCFWNEWSDGKMLEECGYRWKHSSFQMVLGVKRRRTGEVLWKILHHRTNVYFIQLSTPLSFPLSLSFSPLVLIATNLPNPSEIGCRRDTVE